MRLKKPSILQWCGIAGLHPQESRAVSRTWYVLQTIIFLISIWLIIQLYLDLDHIIDPSTRTILLWIFWAIFMVEILIMISICRHRFYYLCSNWFIILILVAAFPIFWSFSPYIAAIRFFQVLVVFLMLFPWLVINAFFSRHYLGWFIVLFLLIAVCCGLLLGFLDPGIGGPWMGVWWAFQTVTLVGYGNIVPQTVIGQIFSILVMFLGISLVALLSASIVSLFRYRAQQNEFTQRAEKDQVIVDEIKKLRQDLQDFQRDKKTEATKQDKKPAAGEDDQSEQ